VSGVPVIVDGRQSQGRRHARAVLAAQHVHGQCVCWPGMAGGICMGCRR
jgi:hypothetical protein